MPLNRRIFCWTVMTAMGLSTAHSTPMRALLQRAGAQR